MLTDIELPDICTFDSAPDEELEQQEKEEDAKMMMIFQQIQEHHDKKVQKRKRKHITAKANETLSAHKKFCAAEISAAKRRRKTKVQALQGQLAALIESVHKDKQAFEAAVTQSTEVGGLAPPSHSKPNHLFWGVGWGRGRQAFAEATSRFDLALAEVKELRRKGDQLTNDEWKDDTDKATEHLKVHVVELLRKLNAKAKAIEHDPHRGRATAMDGLLGALGTYPAAKDCGGTGGAAAQVE